MFKILRQSTAATIKLGPFVDDTDGKTPATGLTILQADIRLSKGGGAFAQTNNATGATHDENGYYGVPLDTTDTATLGRLTIAVTKSGALPVRDEYMVVTANVWDSLVGGTDNLQTDVVKISGDSTAADNAEAAFNGTGYAFQNCVIPLVTDMTTKNGFSLAADQSGVTIGNVNALASGERILLAAAIEAAMINDLDGTAVMQAIADLIASDMNTGDLSVVAIATATRDAILNRVLAGNHDISGSVGERLQSAYWNAYLAAQRTYPLTFVIQELGFEEYGFSADVLAQINAEVDTALTGLNDLDASEIRAAIGMAAANLDTQIALLATAAALTAVKAVIDSVSTEIGKVPKEGKTSKWTNVDSGVVINTGISAYE